MAELGSLVAQAQSVTKGEAQISLEVNIKNKSSTLRCQETTARIANVVKVNLKCQVTMIVML